MPSTIGKTGGGYGKKRIKLSGFRKGKRELAPCSRASETYSGKGPLTRKLLNLPGRRGGVQSSLLLIIYPGGSAAARGAFRRREPGGEGDMPFMRRSFKEKAMMGSPIPGLRSKKGREDRPTRVIGIVVR